jgi:Leucine-rich repeat (LRR) protein
MSSRPVILPPLFAGARSTNFRFARFSRWQDTLTNATFVHYHHCTLPPSLFHSMTSSFVKAPPESEGPAVIRPQDAVLMTTITEEEDETNISQITRDDDEQSSQLFSHEEETSLQATVSIDTTELSINNAFLVDDTPRFQHTTTSTLPQHDIENIIATSSPRRTSTSRPFRLFSTSPSADGGGSSGDFYDEHHIGIDEEDIQAGLVARYRHMVVGLSVLVAMCAMCALIVSLVVVKGSDANSVTDSAPSSAQKDEISEPIQYPSTFLSENHLFLYLRRIFQNSTFSFLSPDTPQSRSLAWLVMEGGQDPTLHLWNEYEMRMPRVLQRYALAVLAFACGGESWRGVTPWMQLNMEHECDWDQITCNDRGQVVGLSLDYIDMTCSLPEELFLLNHLQFFHASQNDIKGTLPSSVSALTDLRDLRLALNDMSYSIPTEIGLLTNLEKIELAFNRITGTLPQELKQLSKLYVLDILANPDLQGPIFDFLPSWPDLQYLIIGLTDLDGSLPTANLQNITELDVRGMKDIISMPDSIGTMTNLRFLRFGNTHNHRTVPISGTIPTEIGHLTELRVMAITDTDMDGPIPSELGQLLQVDECFLNHNSLSGTVPTELGNLINLKHMALSDNELSGALPTEMGALPGLKLLHLEGNQDSLVIPPEVCNNRKIEVYYSCSYVCQCCSNECFA